MIIAVRSNLSQLVVDDFCRVPCLGWIASVHSFVWVGTKQEVRYGILPLWFLGDVYPRNIVRKPRATIA